MTSLNQLETSYYVTNRNPKTIQINNNNKTNFTQSLAKPFKIC